MPSTFSDLKFELIAVGEQSNTWGTTTNTNLGTAIEEAIAGRANANFSTDADLTLTLTDTNATQVARNLILNVTSSVSLTTTRNLVVPTIDKPYIVENNTTGGRSIVVKTGGGSGVTVPNGKTMMVYANGTNVVPAFNQLPSGTTLDTTVISVDSTSDALRITQTGTGNALVVEDSANPDATPFVVTNIGDVGVGVTAPVGTLNVYNVSNCVVSVEGDNVAQTRVTRYSNNASGPILQVRKARGTRAAPTAVASADEVGVINFQAFGGTNYRGVAQVTGLAETYTADDNISGTLIFETRPTGVAAVPLERMRITADGSVGIGVSTPVSGSVTLGNNRPLAWTNASGAFSATAGSAIFKFSDNSLYIDNYDATSIIFRRANYAESMRIDSAGNVGIGTTSPSAKLDVVTAGPAVVKSQSTNNYGSFYANGGTGNAAYYFFAINGTETARLYSDASNYIAFATGSGGVERMRIDSSGNVGIGTTSTGSRLTVQGSGSSVEIHQSVGSIRFSSSPNRSNNYYIGANISDTVDGGFIIGSGNDIASGTPRLRIAADGSFSAVVPGGSTSYPAFWCRAWVNFNGTGTVAIRASGNVTSITDNGVGDYTVNLASAMIDSNFAVVATQDGAVTSGVSVTPITGRTTSSIPVKTISNGALADMTAVQIAIFR